MEQDRTKVTALENMTDNKAVAEKERTQPLTPRRKFAGG